MNNDLTIKDTNSISHCSSKIPILLPLTEIQNDKCNPLFSIPWPFSSPAFPNHISLSLIPFHVISIKKTKKSFSNLTNTPFSSSFSLLVLHSRYFLSLIIQDPFSSHLLRIIKIAHTRHKLRQVLMSNFVEGPRTQHNSAYFLSALQRFLLYGQIALFDPIAQHPRNLGRGLFNRKHQREYIASNRF